MKSTLLRLSWLSLLPIMCLPLSAWCSGIEIIDHRTEQQGLVANTVNAVAGEGDTGVFIASAGGLHILSDDYFLPIFQDIPAVGLSRDPDGDLWAATGTGFIYRITDRDGLWTASRFHMGPGTKVNAIAARFGAVTIATDSGLYSADPDGVLSTVIRKTRFTALAVAGDGTVIAGGRDRLHPGGGLVIIGGTFVGKTGWVDELTGRAIGALCVDGDRLLVGTDADGAFVLSAAGLQKADLPGTPGKITAILAYDRTTVIASDAGLYISVNGGAFESAESLSPDGGAPAGITSLAPGPVSALWVGTENDGVYLIRLRP